MEDKEREEVVDLEGDGEGEAATGSEERHDTPEPKPSYTDVKSADDILNADDRSHIEPVEIPEWGLCCYVRVIGGDERDEIDERRSTGKVKGIRAFFAVKVLCDAKGKRIFKDTHVGALGLKSGSALDRVWDVGAKLNRITSDDIDETEKNLESGQSDNSG